jgi:hypothetical protein
VDVRACSGTYSFCASTEQIMTTNEAMKKLVNSIESPGIKELEARVSKTEMLETRDEKSHIKRRPSYVLL